MITHSWNVTLFFSLAGVAPVIVPGFASENMARQAGMFLMLANGAIVMTKEEEIRAVEVSASDPG